MKTIVFSQEELDLVDELYDEQMTYKGIAESCNQLFHNNKNIRTIDSIKYAIKKIYKLEE